MQTLPSLELESGAQADGADMIVDKIMTDQGSTVNTMYEYLPAQ